MSELKDKIKKKLEGFNMVSLATVSEDGKPWVRYVMARVDDDLTMWTNTAVATKKVAHIRNNPEVHITFGSTGVGDRSPYLQIQGRAEVVTDPVVLKERWSDKLLAYFSGPDDPRYSILKTTPYRIEWHEMGPGEVQVLEI